MSGLRAAILSIGDELVFGETLDRNSAWLSERLASLGVATIEHRTVGDELAEIAEAYRSLAARGSLVISTGGLGPTVDDLTREAMAIAFDGAPSLVADAAAIASIERWFAGRDRPMPESNRRQALRPPSALSLPNSHGTAPGLSIERDGLRVFALPGPPREMQPMFEAQVAPRLAAAPGGEAIAVETVHAFGDGESSLAERIADLMARGRNPSVGTAASPGRVTARIRATGWPAEATAMATAMAEEIATRWSPFAYGRGEETLPGAAAAAVLAAGCTLSVAESCTAGLIGEMIVSVSGASRFFEGGLDRLQQCAQYLATGRSRSADRRARRGLRTGSSGDGDRRRDPGRHRSRALGDRHRGPDRGKRTEARRNRLRRALRPAARFGRGATLPLPR